MSKSVSILITNYNSGDTIALTLESIFKFTGYPHEIMVYDDATQSDLYDDLIYLRALRDRGRIRLIEGRERVMHGRALAQLLDGCHADLAMVMDCDIQVKAHGWLEEMVERQATTKAALVADLESFPDDNIAFSSWFFMLDMAQYQAIKDVWDYTRKDDNDPDKGFRPTGWRIWRNIVARGKTIASIPARVRQKYYHHTHMSVLSFPQSGPCWDIRQTRYAVIQSELRKLRAAK